MIYAGRGDFFVGFCRARASTQTHHMHMHTRPAMQVDAARIRIHEGGRVYRTATEVMPGRRIAMCITHPAHPSLQQRFAPATPAAAQDTRRGARKVTRTCRSAWQVRRLRVALVASRRAAFKHVRGTASTATWMTWLAPQWRALRGSGETKPRIRSPTCAVQLQDISRLPVAGAKSYVPTKKTGWGTLFGKVYYF